MIFSVFFLLFSQVCAHSSRLVKRAICNAYSSNDTLVDDVPNILAALQQCGDTGTVILPQGQRFNIRSPLHLSACIRCNFRIEGVLSISSDWNYWSKQEAAIIISGASNVIVSQQGNSGYIEANNFGWVRTPGTPVPEEMPTLFSVGGGSSQVYLQKIQIKSAPGTVIHVHSGSSAIHFQSTTMEDASTTGYLIEDAQHVYIWTGRVQSTDACVKIAPNVMNVQVDSVTCVGVASEGSAPSGVELQLSGKDGLSWIRNIWVNGVVGIDKLNVVAFTADEDFSLTQSVQVTNATFKKLTFGESSGRGPAIHAVYLDPHHPPLTALDVTFSDFNGTEQYATNLTCGGERDRCSFTQESWSVGVANVTVKG
jgi:hypothetical protein